MKTAPLILVGRLRPDHHGQLRQADPWCDALVRVVRPCRGPHQIARRRRQSGRVVGQWRSLERSTVRSKRWSGGPGGSMSCGDRKSPIQFRPMRTASRCSAIGAGERDDLDVVLTGLGLDGAVVRLVAVGSPRASDPGDVLLVVAHTSAFPSSTCRVSRSISSGSVPLPGPVMRARTGRRGPMTCASSEASASSASARAR